MTAVDRPPSKLAARFGDATSDRLLAGGLIVGGMAAALAGGTDDGLVLCPFRHLTGGYCPACGGTRAVAMAVRGELGAAWIQHPVAVLIAIQLAVLALAVLAAPVSIGRWVRRHAERIAFANVVVLFAIWPVRMALGDIAIPFA
jgi:hypothetical protein